MPVTRLRQRYKELKLPPLNQIAFEAEELSKRLKHWALLQALSTPELRRECLSCGALAEDLMLRDSPLPPCPKAHQTTPAPMTLR